MSENGEIYTAGKKFTLPPAVMAVTNLTSAAMHNQQSYMEFVVQSLLIVRITKQLSLPYVSVRAPC